MSEDANVCKKYGEYMMQAACYCVDDSRQVGTEILGLRKIPAHWSISRFKVAQINRDWHGYNSYNLVGTRTIKVQCKIMSYFPSLDLENVTLTHFSHYV